MIAVDQIIQVKKQLSTGKSHSRIRRSTGVSERTIRRIAAGELDSRLTQELQLVNCPVTKRAVKKLFDQGNSNIQIAAKLGIGICVAQEIVGTYQAQRDQVRNCAVETTHDRCPSCGGLVEMPCLACTIEASRKRNPDVCNIELLSKQEVAELKEQLDIRYTLAPEHLARALEIRERAGRCPR